MEKNMNRMRWNDEMDQKSTEIAQMLDGMHRKTRPGANIEIAMVQRVDVFK